MLQLLIYVWDVIIEKIFEVDCVMSNIPKPIVLIILDRWGYRENSHYNPIKMVDTPTLDSLFSHSPWIF